MPKIPQFESNLPYRGGYVSPEKLSAPERAIAGAGEQIVKVGEQLGALAEAEKKAQEDLDAVTFENNLKVKVDEIHENYLKRDDHENFDKDMVKDIKSLEELAPKNPSQKLNVGIQKALGTYGNALRDAVTRRKYTVMEEKGKVEAVRMADMAALEYANAIDDEGRKLAKDKFELKMDELKKSNLINPLWVENHKLSWEAKAKQLMVDLADVQADKAIEKDPPKAYVDLADPKYLPNLTPKQRQDKREKAWAAIKVWENEQEKKQKELEKKFHDEDDRKVGDLFMDGKLKDAFLSARNSKYLSGDEKRVWGNAIQTAGKEEKVDPATEAAEFSYFTRLSNRPGVDRNVIRNGIIASPRLTLATKKELLRDSEREESVEIRSAKDWAFHYGEGLIVPRRGQTAEFLATPDEIVKNMMFQKSMNDWITNETNKGKPPSGKEIQQRAIETAPNFQMSISERQEKVMKEAKEYMETITKKPEVKTTPPAQPQKVIDIGLARGKEAPTKKYEATATNPNTGDKMGFINGKWELIPKQKK